MTNYHNYSSQEIERDYIFLIKGEHRYFFIYEPGLGEKVAEALMDCAENEDCNLEWRDVLSVIKELQQMKG